MGRLLLLVAAIAFGISGWAFISSLNSGLPAPIWGGILALIATITGVSGTWFVSYEKNAAAWLSAAFLLIGVSLLAGLIIIKTGWGGETNIGAGGIFFIGMHLLPVAGVIALLTVIVTWVRDSRARTQHAQVTE
ncbi:hypothetical protein [Leucobacter sp. NPDC077196]|uniref:Uncharacterized protein n=2 Tax=Leucobacter chromiiresistens TaxID=1079994 RepID=A0A1H0YJR8_9MICO|nr:hypothetical protein SAMN04488565_0923 [Leucobacter chromiiresistens]